MCVCVCGDDLCGLYDGEVVGHTCVVCMMVRSFIQEIPGPMAALRPAVPNSILDPKHLRSSSTAPSSTRPCTNATVWGFYRRGRGGVQGHLCRSSRAPSWKGEGQLRVALLPGVTPVELGPLGLFILLITTKMHRIPVIWC